VRDRAKRCDHRKEGASLGKEGGRGSNTRTGRRRGRGERARERGDRGRHRHGGRQCCQDSQRPVGKAWSYLVPRATKLASSAPPSPPSLSPPLDPVLLRLPSRGSVLALTQTWRCSPIPLPCAWGHARQRLREACTSPLPGNRLHEHSVTLAKLWRLRPGRTL
jgi:hypothetical protein